MFGIGKKRTNFGKKLDKMGINQAELEKESGLSRATISKLCNDNTYSMKRSTEISVRKALKNLGVNEKNFFG
ncbi:helix-turn-helix transcriptional regulator [Bacillus sp. JCM 19041]|uniref:helix-turn-helix domain-containing protein n=1 Tax=Bacillus sp. JCM 19041 TaxID=1460637 RepID=UPI0006D1C713